MTPWHAICSSHHQTAALLKICYTCDLTMDQRDYRMRDTDVTDIDNKDEGIKIIQDPKILQQIFKFLPDGGSNQINVVMIGKISSVENQSFEFMRFLNELPMPRMQSLRNEAIRIARNFLRSDEKTANFLGISRTTLSPSYKLGKTSSREDEP